MSKFIIQGGKRLEGEVKISGSKNAALPLMACSMLTDDVIVLNNIPNIEFYAGDVGKILSRKNYHPNVVIVDPPRSGLDSFAIKEIINIKPRKMVYVSCDLMTLARDLNILSQYFEIKELTPVDLFPQTSHVESVVKLELKDNL